MEFVVKHKVPIVMAGILFGLFMVSSGVMVLFTLVLLFHAAQHGIICEHVYTPVEQGYNRLHEPTSRATHALNNAKMRILKGDRYGTGGVQAEG
jgi:hypothetical protein